MANQHTRARAAAAKAAAAKAETQQQQQSPPQPPAETAPAPVAPAPEETAATTPETPPAPPPEATPPPAKPAGPIQVRALADGYGGIPVAFRRKGEEFPVAAADLGRWMQRLDGAAGTTSPSTAGEAAPEGSTPTGDQSVI